MNKAAFLDRDGVINRKAPEGDYIVHWNEVDILPGVVEAIRFLNQADYKVIVVTNQRAIAKNRITLPGLADIHRQFVKAIEEGGATLDRIYFCPHDVESKCDCRKPQPGMLLRAMRDFDIDPRQSWMIGDSITDVEAGTRAGCRTVLVRTASNDCVADVRADIFAPNLYGAVERILREDMAPLSARLKSTNNS